MPGIKFNLSGTSDYGTKVNETLYTDAEGKITRRNLEKGTYTLKETETNSDFFLNDTVFTVTVNMNGDLTINGSTEVKPYARSRVRSLSSRAFPITAILSSNTARRRTAALSPSPILNGAPTS